MHEWKLCTDSPSLSSFRELSSICILFSEEDHQLPSDHKRRGFMNFADVVKFVKDGHRLRVGRELHKRRKLSEECGLHRVHEMFGGS